MSTIKRINQLEIEVGNIVHAYGARFEIFEIHTYAERDENLIAMGRDKVVAAVGKWIDGRIEPGYFGPDKNFNFQGNAGVSLMIEC
ncbi:hypothetical protein [Burkholderia sp. KJ006]|uniref:hypothetical protein n=1 Tax=Burkholderia sp. KJ006 TaxID=416344 RepID=UPI0005A28740|nr:hypothetical protein [Burkholderia sp. KJ006]